MEGVEEIISLWVGPHSQKAAHHFYTLQVSSMLLRLNNFSRKRKILPTSTLFGHLKIEI
jgi:hypothetical protein